MKIKDSGMPEESYWNSLFNIDSIVDWLEIPNNSRIVEMGCGYGTFTVPIAKIDPLLTVSAFDIEPEMIDTTGHHLESLGLSNAKCILRDLLTEGTGLDAQNTDLVLLFNILHFEESRVLIEEASRILKPNGRIAIIHWRKDIPTPRGPAIELRPEEAQIAGYAKGLDLSLRGKSTVLEPYHFGMQLVKG